MLPIIQRSYGILGKRFPYSVIAFSKKNFSTQIESIGAAKTALDKISFKPDRVVSSKIFALYQQATVGDCPNNKQTNESSVEEWRSWKSVSGMSKLDAQSKYVSLINALVSSDNFEEIDGLKHTVTGNGVLEIVLDRPKKKNAATLQMFNGIKTLLEKATYNPKTNMVTISGSGDFFSSGFDFGLFKETVARNESLKDAVHLLLSTVHGFVDALIDFPKPLIGLVNGPTIGIAATTLPLYDYVISSDKAYILTPFSKLGVVPEGCSSYTYPLILGPNKASELLIFNQRLAAKDACAFGLINRVIPDESFKQDCVSIVEEFASLAPEITQAIKESLRENSRAKLHEVNAVECEQLVTIMTSSEYLQKLFEVSQPKPSK